MGVTDAAEPAPKIPRKCGGQPGCDSVAIENRPDVLGPEKFFPEEARQNFPPGVAAGLAWTEAGGETLSLAACLTRRT